MCKIYNYRVFNTRLLSIKTWNLKGQKRTCEKPESFSTALYVSKKN